MKTLPWIVLAAALVTMLPFWTAKDKDNNDDKENKAAETEKPSKAKPDNPAEAGKSSKKTPPDKAAPKEENCQSDSGSQAADWCEPVRVLRDFFGLELHPEFTLSKNLEEIAAEASKGKVNGEQPCTAHYNLRFMVAFIPDPLDSELPALSDLVVDGIQKGFASSDFQFSRFWLPWIADADKANRLYRRTPGVILFRRHQKKETPSDLEIVFVVGESPKAGIQRSALELSLELIKGLQPNFAPQPPVILGPTFSGSADSVATAFESWNCNGSKPCLWMATGTATATDLETHFPKDTFSFCRTVASDEALQRAGFAFLRNEMGWNFRRAALLSEEDTAFGQQLQDLTVSSSIQVPFPLHISDVRNAWQEDAKDKKTDDKVTVGNVRLQTGRPALDLNLGDPQAPVDFIPNFSALTVPAKDLELSNLLETISREGIRYVGVVATDPKDKLFLFQKIRQFSPDTVLFTTDSNILFAHPGFSESLDGLVVLSSSPLFTEGANWLPVSSMSERQRYRRQFRGEFQQGIFEAVGYLLRLESHSRPQVWVSVVGNGSLWPIARLPTPETSAHICSASSPAKEPLALSQSGDHVVAPRSNLEMLLMAGLLCLLSFGLCRVGLLKTGKKVRIDVPVDRALMALGSILLALAASTLLVVAAIPEWLPIFDGQSFAWGGRLRFGFLALLTLTYGYLAFQAATVLRKPRPQLKPAYRVLAMVLSVLAPFGLMFMVFRFWMLGQDPGLFHLRARALNSGLSPLVSLGLLGGAFYVWILCELQRKWLVLREASTCPLESLEETSIHGLEPVLGELETWLKPTFPRKLEFWVLPAAIFIPTFSRKSVLRELKTTFLPWLRLWVLPAAVFVPPLFMLWGTLQPVAETRYYGRIFLLFLIVVASLAALSYYRFVQIWLGLYKIVRRFDHASPGLVKTFKDLGKEIDWKPMKSFGFQVSSFKMLALSVHKLQSLVGSKWVTGIDSRSLNEDLENSFHSEAAGRTLAELESRKSLETKFKEACCQLKVLSHVPSARAFLALRVADYLRYLFAHLRSCLLGAVGTGLLLLLAVTAYAFEPKQFILLAIWIVLAIAVALTFWIFLQTDRNATLSWIGDTDPGKVSFDRSFYTNLLTYVALPVLGIVATQFPEIGRLLGRLADQILHVAGGG